MSLHSYGVATYLLNQFHNFCEWTVNYRYFTFTVMLVRLKGVSSRTITIITTFCIHTLMGACAIIIKTFINICNNNVIATISICMKKSPYNQYINTYIIVTRPTKTGHICRNCTHLENGTFCGHHSQSMNFICFLMDSST